MPSAQAGSRVAWLPWGADAFARAARQRRPVLLSISAAWSHACHEMDRTTYADARVAATIGDRFVPVRVDADRRPDINERYNLGGWPTTAFLTGEGALLGGGTFVSVDRMPGVLARVVEAFESRFGDIERARVNLDTDHEGHPEPVTAPAPEALVDLIFGSFDDDFAGFGVEPKFPHTAPVHLALSLYQETEDPRYRDIASRTLDAMLSGGLHDAVGGGFFRYAAARDWQLPHLEKLLDTNAAILRLCVDAAVALKSEPAREQAAEIADYVRRRLAAPDGGYYGSEEAAPAYYAVVEAAARASLPQPAVDRALYADANAAMASALIAAAAVLDREDLAREALASLERVLLACYRPGEGVAHYFDSHARVRGLLADQVGMIHALLDAHELTGDEPYHMMAQELAHYAVRTMWDAEGGGLFDRGAFGDDIGLLRGRRKPFVTNCAAARAMARLARSSGEADFAARADAILRVAAPMARDQGPLAAHYLLAMREAGVR